MLNNFTKKIIITTLVVSVLTGGYYTTKSSLTYALEAFSFIEKAKNTLTKSGTAETSFLAIASQSGASVKEVGEAVAVTVYRTINGLFTSPEKKSSNVQIVVNSKKEANSEQQVASSEEKQVSKDEVSIDFFSGSEVSREDLSGNNSQQGTTIINPIREVIKETVVEKVVSGVTQTDLQILENKLKDEIYRTNNNTQSTQNRTVNTNYAALALLNRIDKLRNTDIITPTITGGSMSGTSLSGVTITGSSFDGSTGTFSGLLTGTSATFSGNVGIGTTTPTEKLAINGAVYLSPISSPSVTIDRLYNVSNDLYWGGNLIGGSSTANWATDGTNAWRAGGNVGIGTTTPAGKLHVKGDLIIDDGSSNMVIAGRLTDLTVTGTENTIINLWANGSNTISGGQNTALGAGVLNVNTTGYRNTAIGTYSLVTNTTGIWNTALGYQSMADNVSGGANVALGYKSLENHTSGNNNTVIGVSAGGSNITGAGNIFLGYSAGQLETGSNKLYIDNSNSASPLIYGEFDNNIVNINGSLGIGTTSPFAKLSITGSGTGTGLAFQVADSTDSPKFTVLDNGNVGIGTNSPASALDIRNGDIFVIGSGDPRIVLGDDTGSNWGFIRYDSSDDEMQIGKNGGATLSFPAGGGAVGIDRTFIADEFWATNGTVSNPRILLGDEAATGNYGGMRWDSTLDILKFGHSGSSTLIQDMVIDTNGNIGIGTTSPTAKLDIYQGNLNLDNTTNANQYGVISKNGTRFIHNFNYGDNGTVTTTGRNTFIGENAGNLTMGSTATSASHASYNTAVGYQSLYSNTTGNYNSAQGYYSLYSNTTGIRNSAQGSYSLRSNTAGNNNSAQGAWSLHSNTTGSNNSAQGMYSLYTNTTGSSNSAQGVSSLRYNTTGSQNSAQGYYSLYSNTTGNQNSAQGYQSLYSNTTGIRNSAQGTRSLYSNTTGSNNLALGYNSGRYIADGVTGNTTGDYNTFLGMNTKALADNDQNEIVIGYNATGIGSNSVTLGNDSILTTALKGNVGIGTTSPSYKLDVTGFINTDGTTGGYKIDGNTVLQASSTNFSTLAGIGAGASLLSDGISNTALGYQSLYTSTSADSNTAIGYQTLRIILQEIVM